MPYFIIEKMPVFLPRSRYQILEEEAGKDKGAQWRVQSNIAFDGNKAAEEKSALMYNILLRKFREDTASFSSEWVCFDLWHEEASENVWDLLFDYCHFRGYAFLSDIRDAVTKIKEDYEGNDYLYPMGRAFLLNHFVQPSWWWRLFRRSKGRRISIFVDTKEVVRIVGNLSQFKVCGQRFVLSCGENLTVRCLSAQESPSGMEPDE